MRSNLVLEHGRLRVEVAAAPLAVTVRRDGTRLVGPIEPRVRDGEILDHFVQWTEGVIAAETLGDPLVVTAFEGPSARLEVRLADGTEGVLEVMLPERDRILLELNCAPSAEPAAERPVRRLGFAWPGHPEQRVTGLGARHGLHVDQAGRSVALGADRRYTGPDCPADMLDHGRHPAGRLRAGAVGPLVPRLGRLAGDRRAGRAFALGDEIEISARAAAGPLRLHLFCARRPPRACAASCAPPARSRRSCLSGPTATGRAATSTSTSATSRPTSTAIASTGCRSTRS